MSIRIECPSCGRVGNAPAGSSGRTGKCPVCGSMFAIPRSQPADFVKAFDGPALKPPDAPSGLPPLPQHPASGPSSHQTVVYVNQTPTNGLGVAGFVLSLLGLLSCGCISPIGLLLSMAGLSQEPRGLAIAGTILGGLGSAWVFFFVVLFLRGLVALPF